MTTKKLVPRASGEGAMGVTDNVWGEAYYDTGNFNKGLFLSGHNITQVIAETVTQGGLGGEWTKAVNGLDIYYNGGNVGIGTTDPVGTLELSSTTGTDTNLYMGGTPTIGTREPWRVQSEGDFLHIGQVKSSFAKYMTFKGSNVGIGTTNPSTALDINKGLTESSPIITLSRGGTSKSRFAIANATDSILDGALTDDLCIRTEGGNIRFGTASATKTDMSILSNGNVGIGTTNPTGLLQLRSKKVTQLTGSVVLVAGNNVVDGTLTDFTNQLKVGDEVILETQIYTILSIQSALQLTVSDVTPSWGNVSAAGIYRNTARSLMLADEKTAHIGVGFADVADSENIPATLTVARLDQNETNAALSVFRGDTSAGDRPTAPIFNVINGEAGGTEVFRVQGNGNVGLTTASPANKLVIAGSSDTNSDLLNLCPALAIENTFGDYTDDQVFGIIGFSRTGAVANVNGSFVDGVRAGIVCRYEGNNTDLGANTGNVGTKLEFKTSPTNAGDSNVAMTIRGNGNVGIGTTNPGNLLHVKGDGHSKVLIEGGNSHAIGLQIKQPLISGDQVWQLQSEAGNSSLQIRGVSGGNAAKVVQHIQADGNIGIGTTNPGAALSVYRENTGVPDTAFASIEVLTKNTDTAANLKIGWLTQIGCYSLMSANGALPGKNALIGVYRDSAGSNEAAILRLARSGQSGDQYFWVDDAGKFRTALSSSSVGSNTLGTVVGDQTSDERIKNIEDSFEYGLSDILKLKPIAFTFKEQKDDSRKLGFGAQSVQPIIPESVYDSKECLDGYDPDPEDESGTRQIPKSDKTKLVMEYTQLIPVLTKAIQEQQQLIEDLRSEVEALKNK